MNQSENHSEPIEVAIVLETLRSEVRARHEAFATDDERRTAYRTTERQLEHCAEQLEITRVISAHWPLEHRSLAERGINLVHKIVRRSLRWYINPIVEQQNAFNDVAARTMRLLIDGYSELSSQVAEITSEEHTAGTEHRRAARPHSTTDTPPTAELQMLVEQRGRDEPLATFPDLALPLCPAHLAASQQVQAHWPLIGAHGIVIVQKVIRQYLRWLINPIVEQQNMFNTALTDSIAPMITADAEVRAMVAAVRAAWARQRRGADHHKTPGPGA